MATFAVEADVRLKFQLDDTTLVPSGLIQACLEDAHRDVLRYLEPAFNIIPPDEGLAAGEAVLAGAYLFRSLAAKDAFGQKQIVIGGQRIDAGQRFDALMTMASATEAKAWSLLDQYLSVCPSQTLAAATDSVPVLGEE